MLLRVALALSRCGAIERSCANGSSLGPVSRRDGVPGSVEALALLRGAVENSLRYQAALEQLMTAGEAATSPGPIRP